jgi:hypothetical protein
MDDPLFTFLPRLLRRGFLRSGFFAVVVEAAGFAFAAVAFFAAGFFAAGFAFAGAAFFTAGFFTAGFAFAGAAFFTAGSPQRVSPSPRLLSSLRVSPCGSGLLHCGFRPQRVSPSRERLLHRRLHRLLFSAFTAVAAYFFSSSISSP